MHAAEPRVRLDPNSYKSHDGSLAGQTAVALRSRDTAPGNARRRPLGRWCRPIRALDSGGTGAPVGATVSSSRADSCGG
jgi:hypothetical protein